jgi:two-component system chemotaxis sensor kinase CheA
MTAADDAFMRELTAAFTVEAGEHLQAISSGLLQLEENPQREDRALILETIYREAHSLKGAARAVSFSAIETVCQALEGVLAAWKKGIITLSGRPLDVLFKAVDVIGRSVSSGGGLAGTDELCGELAKMAVGAGSGKVESGSPPVSPAGETVPVAADRAPAGTVAEGTETVRVSTAKLDSLLFQAEEMLAVKQASRHRAYELSDLLGMAEIWEKRWIKLQPEIRRAGQPSTAAASGPGGERHVEAFAELLEWNTTCLRTVRERLTQAARQLAEDERMIGRMVDGLLESAKRAVMVPAVTVLQTFPRMVRDLCHSQNKKVEFVISGDDIEIDKRILEEMKDPMTHLLRNCIDHGIELPKERERKGKPAVGRVTVFLSQADSRTVQIDVSDDGAGVNTAEVRAAAVRQGLLSQEEVSRLSDQEAQMLVFASSLSTRNSVTNLSGRGLGLAIVREKVEKLGGRVSLQTEADAGTSIRIVLPLTLATFRGVLVEASGRIFVVPTACVERVLRIVASDIQTVENRETICVNGKTVACARLHAVLGLPAVSSGKGASATLVLLLAIAERRVAFLVDRVIAEQEVLVKSLGRQLLRVRNVAGATVLGSGELVPILNVSDLLQSAARGAGAPAVVQASAETGTRARRQQKSILLVEDSITSRMLIKNIMEAAGYAVKTSVDGLAAWTELKTGTFDAVVSDVEMPRMDGFSLTEKIRADAGLADLPVVLVTSRETQDDRERGIDAGANAYIVKSRFEQSNLLSALERLV